ncbi:SGF29 tudor-like domain-containing protein [Actinidia rufa]|uniref:SGF29 tudor-like domain-containing protein n=1 Tax=Actinidia rufa TaxID=165716 RepID=A0A7J0ENT7_9ERIC|nr:SGF29 tudor-like domain-containing protein [Actinidia rufa]
MSSPDIAAILEISKDLDRLRKDQEEILLDINKMHKKLQSGESLSHRYPAHASTLLRSLFDRFCQSVLTLDLSCFIRAYAKCVL